MISKKRASCDNFQQSQEVMDGDSIRRRMGLTADALDCQSQTRAESRNAGVTSWPMTYLGVLEYHAASAYSQWVVPDHRPSIRRWAGRKARVPCLPPGQCRSTVAWGAPSARPPNPAGPHQIEEDHIQIEHAQPSRCPRQRRGRRPTQVDALAHDGQQHADDEQAAPTDPILPSRAARVERDAAHSMPSSTISVPKRERQRCFHCLLLLPRSHLLLMNAVLSDFAQTGTGNVKIGCKILCHTILRPYQQHSMAEAPR